MKSLYGDAQVLSQQTRSCQKINQLIIQYMYLAMGGMNIGLLLQSVRPSRFDQDSLDFDLEA